MAVLHETRTLTAPVGPRTRLGRVIVVGVRDTDHDSPTLRWAEREALVGVDVVHLVHAYVPLRLDGCTWDPVRRERDARALAGRRVTAQAVQRVRAACPGLLVEGSTVQGLPDDVLHEFSCVVDLVVIGDDSGAPDRIRKIAWRVQDHARCPVISVPRAPSPAAASEPVTVVLTEAGLAEAALRFGAETAVRHDLTLQVSRSWTSLHEEPRPSPTWLAHQQEELDGQLADWRERYPQVPIVARIELDDDWLLRVAAGSSLLVGGRGAAALLRLGRAPVPCPVAIVPDPDGP
jgi:hypothetical protein